VAAMTSLRTIVGGQRGLSLRSRVHSSREVSHADIRGLEIVERVADEDSVVDRFSWAGTYRGIWRRRP